MARVKGGVMSHKRRKKPADMHISAENRKRENSEDFGSPEFPLAAK